MAILVAAVISRFYDVGVRAMSHDESLHVVYSLDLYRKGFYEHNPMMHGPFLFHFNALIYGLFGVTDATSRFMPALLGIGTVMMAWPFRRWLGRTGALMVGLLILVSPSLLYHSRYIRNDIYIAFFGMLWVYGMFRYLEQRETRWLYVMISGMALGFIAKENQFMTGAVFGVFTAGVAAWQWLRQGVALTRNPFADLSVLMLTLVLPFTAPVFYLAGELALGWEHINWNGFNPTNTVLVRISIMTLISTALAIGLGWLWFGRLVDRGQVAGSRRQDKTNTPIPNTQPHLTFSAWAGLMLTFWVIQIVFFTTFFTNPVKGLATGVVGSLGYWLAQQEVARGGQPWFYYIMQTGIYEFLPFILSVGGLIALLIGLFGKEKQRWEPTPLHDLPAAVAGISSAAQAMPFRQLRVMLILFLVWWNLGAWFAYSYAGEKMPWLLVHIAQPMTLVGGWWLGRLIQRIDWSVARQKQTLWLVGLTPALIFVLFTLFSATPFQGRDVQSLSQTMRFVMASLALAGLLYWGWTRINRGGWSSAWRLMMVGLSGVLLLLTVRFAYMLTYVNYDMATEYLVYAHAGPDVKRALAEIELISERTVGDKQIRVAYDDNTAWPMTWYMRFYPNSLFYGANPSAEAMSFPVVLVGSANYAKVDPYLARDYIHRTYRMIWWPEESYKNWTLSSLLEPFTNPQARENLWQIWFYRNHPTRDVTAWPHRHEFRLYIRADVASLVWDLNVTPFQMVGGPAAIEYDEIERSAVAIYGGIQGNAAIRQPRDVAVGEDGRRYIADTGNDRIVVLDANGGYLFHFGNTCHLNDAEQTGCVDPDGAGPLQLGDGQFREPWGVTVGQDGTIFVADTWNGRIQSFSPEGEFLRKWGFYGIASEENRDPFVLFGPRGLAIAENGDLLVADTGNKRIVRYTPTGQAVGQVGGGGRVLGRFEEPVDVAVHPVDGRIYVADIWNQRIQILSPNLEPLDEWPVPSWESRDLWDKAYLAVDDQGMVYASDPQYARVFIYAADGTLQASFGRYGAELNRMAKPNGLAVDPTTQQLILADADNNRVLVFSGE
jgi:uncharacterized protein (TIGR03663 family)